MEIHDMSQPDLVSQATIEKRSGWFLSRLLPDYLREEAAERQSRLQAFRESGSVGFIGVNVVGLAYNVEALNMNADYQQDDTDGAQ